MKRHVVALAPPSFAERLRRLRAGSPQMQSAEGGKTERKSQAGLSVRQFSPGPCRGLGRGIKYFHLEVPKSFIKLKSPYLKYLQEQTDSFHMWRNIVARQKRHVDGLAHFAMNRVKL